VGGSKSRAWSVGRRAREVRDRALDCGHYVPEERPQEVAAELEAFFVE
jgi:haloacetate dehalogenase